MTAQERLEEIKAFQAEFVSAGLYFEETVRPLSEGTKDFLRAQAEIFPELHLTVAELTGA